MRRLRRLVLAQRFVRGEDGAVAVEFGIVLLPFLTMMFVIMETGLVFFAQQALETAAADSGRLIMTGQANAASMDQFYYKCAVCKNVYGLFDCTNKMYVDVQSYGSFGTISNTVTYNSQGQPITNFSPGHPGDIVVVRLIYQWPISIPLVQPLLADPNSKNWQLVATTVFKNEPYTPTTPPPPTQDPANCP